MDEICLGTKEWFFGLGDQYGVDPIVFGAIYLGAIPFFTVSVAWLIRNARANKSIAFPALSSGFWFVSAYLYLFVAGKNIPVWVYGFIGLLLAYGVYSSIRSIQKKIAARISESET